MTTTIKPHTWLQATSYSSMRRAPLRIKSTTRELCVTSYLSTYRASRWLLILDSNRGVGFTGAAGRLPGAYSSNSFAI